MGRVTRNRDSAYWVHSAPDDEMRQSSRHEALPTLETYTERAMATCPGECSRKWKRANPKAMDELRLAAITREESVPYEPDERVVMRAWDAMVMGKPVWCDECTETIRVALGSMYDLAVACRRIGGGSGRLAPAPAIEKGMHQKIAAAPSPSPAYDMFDLIVRWPLEWGASSFSGLQGKLAELLSGPDARRFGHAALELRRRAQLAAGEDRLVHHMPAPCITCGRKSLERQDGADVIECAHCHKTLGMADYQAYAAAYRASLETGESA